MKNYVRRCKRCGDIFPTEHRRARFCKRCKLPVNPGEKRKIRLICRRCGFKSRNYTKSRRDFVLRNCKNCGFKTNHTIKELIKHGKQKTE